MVFSDVFDHAKGFPGESPIGNIPEQGSLVHGQGNESIGLNVGIEFVVVCPPMNIRGISFHLSGIRRKSILCDRPVLQFGYGRTPGGKGVFGRAGHFHCCSLFAGVDFQEENPVLCINEIVTSKDTTISRTSQAPSDPSSILLQLVDQFRRKYGGEDRSPESVSLFDMLIRNAGDIDVPIVADNGQNGGVVSVRDKSGKQVRPIERAEDLSDVTGRILSGKHDTTVGPPSAGFQTDVDTIGPGRSQALYGV